MPDLVGMNLQEAQDALQRLTAFGVTLSTSSDAHGEARSQVLDRNWKVCDQDPPAGSTITSATVPDFSVVRTSESC
jgi:beta-lactam-binding protein with PASTA domain